MNRRHVFLCALLACAPGAALAQSADCAVRSNNTVDKLTACVTLEGVRAHQAVLQAIADASGGNRAAGTAGYDASVEYVAGELSAAGYTVTLQPFPFVYVAPAILRQTAPVTATLDTGAFTFFLYAFQQREKIYDIFETLCGARFTNSYTRVGGVMYDMTSTGLAGLRAMQPLSTMRSPGGAELRIVRPLLEVSRAETGSY